MPATPPAAFAAQRCCRLTQPCGVPRGNPCQPAKATRLRTNGGAVLALEAPPPHLLRLLILIATRVLLLLPLPLCLSNPQHLIPLLGVQRHQRTDLLRVLSRACGPQPHPLAAGAILLSLGHLARRAVAPLLGAPHLSHSAGLPCGENTLKAVIELTPSPAAPLTPCRPGNALILTFLMLLLHPPAKIPQAAQVKDGPGLPLSGARHSLLEQKRKPRNARPLALPLTSFALLWVPYQCQS